MSSAYHNRFSLAIFVDTDEEQLALKQQCMFISRTHFIAVNILSICEHSTICEAQNTHLKGPVYGYSIYQ